ncbi:Hsp20/alpha crystallin family protein [Sphingomonas sp. MMSM24]|uniref:Hsp20/alpha crystallin family protein n=2 Tax=Sphingomonas lycopersici TaxID=2951807 RepID=A0AA41Z9J8_9SPHN|nr:Hsp20/alpha crystallin family protein [Sphingomonas lycopersici]
MFDEMDRPNHDFFAPFTVFSAPAIDMVERDGVYRLTAELPGLTDEDVKISVSDHQLIISGEKRQKDERKDDGFMLRERRYGSFERHVILPVDAQEEGIDATFDKGVLTVTVSKSKETPDRGRRITIRKAE